MSRRTKIDVESSVKLTPSLQNPRPAKREVISSAVLPRSTKRGVRPTVEQINDWVKSVYRAAGIGYVEWSPTSIGLLRVPPKYIEVFSALRMGMIELNEGRPLPEVLS